MANIEEAIRRLQFLYETHGAEEVAAAQRAITASTETTEKASLSLERSFGNLERRYISTVRAQQEYDRAVRVANDAVKQNPALQERANAVINAAQTQYIRAAQGAGTYGQAVLQTADSSRLARHEMINLSRQIQDVGVSLASGQSPLTVAIQQGAQIADVFATSSGTVMGFFRQAGAAAAGFAASTAGIVTGIVAVGAAVVYSAASYASAQREVAKALSGIGAASGVTKDQINAIGDASSSAFGISKSEAREAATAFASTGDIYAGNVAQATKLVNDFARAGVDSATASKNLAAAMADPAAGALEMNKSLGFLNATTLNYIRSLQAQGREQEAQAALMTAMTPKVQEQSKFTSYLAMAWNAVANAVSNTNTAVGKSTTTGGGGTAATIAAGTPAGPSQDAMRAQEEQINRMKAAYQGLSSEGTAALNKLSLQADAGARAFLPLKAQIEQTQQLLARLRQYQAVTGGTENAAAITVGQVRLQQLMDQEQVLIRQAQWTQQIAAQYPGMSIEVAKQLDAMNQQLQVAQARTGAEQIVAQQYADQNRYLAEGKGLEEALALAAANRQIAEANVSRAIADQIHSLEDQVRMSNARIAGTEAATAAEIAYNNAKRQGASDEDAARLRAATTAASDARDREKAIRDVGREGQALKYIPGVIEDTAQATNGATDGMHHFGWEIAHVTMQAYQMVDAFAQAQYQFHFLLTMAEQIDQRLRDMPTQFGNEQFTIETDPLKLQAKKAGLEASVGAGNVEAFQQLAGTPQAYTDYRISQSYLDQQNAKGIEGLNVSSPSAIQSSLQQVLSMGNTDAANRLIDLADPSQQTSLIQQTIDYIRQSEPPGLASEEKIQALNQKLEQLANSTDSLNATMQSALSPFYSQDPRTTKLGFRAGVTGNPDWATGAGNANPLVAVLGPGATAPGMAGGGSFVVGGGYSANDNRMAVFPVASGEEIVVNRNKEGTGGQVVHIDNRIFVSGNVDNDALSKMKVSRYQQAQRMRAGMAQA